jgi:hypothetical protein
MFITYKRLKNINQLQVIITCIHFLILGYTMNYKRYFKIVLFKIVLVTQKRPV